MVTLSKSNLDLGSDYSVDPLQPAIEQLTNTSVDECRAENAAYWRNYWGRAAISLPTQPTIERFWFVVRPANVFLKNELKNLKSFFFRRTICCPRLLGPHRHDLAVAHFRTCGDRG